MSQATWTVAQGKAKLHETVDQALAQGPQTVTRGGRTAGVLISTEESERKIQRTGNLAEFFAASPLPGSDLKIERLGDHPRETGL